MEIKIGYARVSTVEQNLDLQIDALRQAGCTKFYSDEVTGTKADREGLEKARQDLREGDTLVVWRLDRLGRSIKDLIKWVQELDERGIGFVSLHENIDTSTATGRFTFHLFGALAEFERNIIIERTQAGLRAARARGRKGGRPPALSPKKRQRAVELYNEKKLSLKEICDMMGVSKTTLYSYIGCF